MNDAFDLSMVFFHSNCEQKLNKHISILTSALIMYPISRGHLMKECRDIENMGVLGKAAIGY